MNEVDTGRGERRGETGTGNTRLFALKVWPGAHATIRNIALFSFPDKIGRNKGGPFIMSFLRRKEKQEAPAERRREERCDAFGPVLIEDAVSGHGKQTVEGVTGDMTSTGASIYAGSPLAVNSVVTIRGKTTEAVPERKAIVRWCRQEEDGTYKMGIAFLSAE
jgi:hypothetical protein